MSFTTPKKQQKKIEEMEKQRKRNAEVEVAEKMMTLVRCMWVCSAEYKARSKKLKNMEPEPEHQKSLIKKAAKILKKTYKHDRDVFGIDEIFIKYYLASIQQYIDSPELGDCWDGMDDYEKVAVEKSKEKSEKKTTQECTKPKYTNVTKSWLTRD